MRVSQLQLHVTQSQVQRVGPVRPLRCTRKNSRFILIASELLILHGKGQRRILGTEFVGVE